LTNFIKSKGHHNIDLSTQKTKKKGNEGHMYTYMKHESPNIFSNENKSILKNIVKCDAFLSMDRRKKVYSHLIYKLTINATSQAKNHWMREAQSGVQCYEEDDY
jgi:hypothetical protein